MTLIECSQCGKEVSEKASVCPNCGSLVTEPESQKTVEEFIANAPPEMREVLRKEVEEEWVEDAELLSWMAEQENSDTSTVVKEDGKTRYLYFGLGVSSVISIVFIVLRVMGHIKWSLWWTLSPLWIFFSAMLGIFGIIGVLYTIEQFYELRKGAEEEWDD